jgi:hypothetical protein
MVKIIDEDIVFEPVNTAIWPICVSWKSRVIGFGHAELDIGDADRAEYR